MARRALVYRGAAACDGHPEALADLLRRSAWGFEVHFVGKKEALQLTPQTLATAELYAQPGGGNSVQRAYRKLRRHSAPIREYVAGGGRYLGICRGGHLAGHRRGFRLLPEGTEQFITSPGASVTSARDTLVDVEWRGVPQRLFFQDGPFFRIPPGSPGARGATVLARYASNHEIAAMTSSFGRGRVGVCGPHPEAPAAWYVQNGLPMDSPAIHLGLDLVDTLMRA
jgi:glutamine amidotransferase-like uncharacterized protein